MPVAVSAPVAIAVTAEANTISGMAGVTDALRRVIVGAGWIALGESAAVALIVTAPIGVRVRLANSDGTAGGPRVRPGQCFVLMTVYPQGDCPSWALCGQLLIRSVARNDHRTWPHAECDGETLQVIVGLRAVGCLHR